MNRNNCKYKKVYIYSCKNFLIAIIVLQDLWEWSCSCLFLNLVDSVLNTEKLHMNLYERCLGPCGGVEHSKNYLAEPQLARIYVTVVTSFLFSWCRILWIKKMQLNCSKQKAKRQFFLPESIQTCILGLKSLDSGVVTCLSDFSLVLWIFTKMPGTHGHIHMHRWKLGTQSFSPSTVGVTVHFGKICVFYYSVDTIEKISS